MGSELSKGFLAGLGYLDTISERTADHGVEIDGLTIKDAGFELGSDADGDMYARISGALTRIPKGVDGQILTSHVGLIPTWETHTLTNLLSNSGFGVWSNSTLENVGSDLVTNGSAWTGASGTTPPTGWTRRAYSGSGGTDSFSNAGGYLTMGNDNCAPVIEQAITTVIGKLYRISVYHINGTGSCRVMASSGAGVTGTVLLGNDYYSDVSWTTRTFVFEAVSTTTYIYLGNESTYNTCFDNVTLYEVTPACIAADTNACDGWIKGVDTLIYRQHKDATYTKPGSFYALKISGSSDTEGIVWPKNYTDPAHLENFAGKTVALGCWVYTTIASNSRFLIFDGITSTYSSYHTGVAGWQWLETHATLSSDPTNVTITLRNDISGEISYFSQPMLIFGSYIGEGNYQPILNETITLETDIHITTLEKTGYSDTGSTVINIEAATLGKLPKGAKLIKAGYINVNDSGSATVATDCYLGLGYGANVLYISPSGRVNDGPERQSGWFGCDSNGDSAYLIEATGSATFDLATLSLGSVQL